MTWKQIETSREARLWIGQIVIPAATVMVTALAVPEVRDAAKTRVQRVKNFIKTKRKKN